MQCICISKSLNADYLVENVNSKNNEFNVQSRVCTDFDAYIFHDKEKVHESVLDVIHIKMFTLRNIAVANI